MPRIPRAPLLLGAGLLSAGLLGLTGTGTLSSISAQVLTQPNSVSLGRMVLELRSGDDVCRSSDDVSDVFSCQTIQPLSGRSDLMPGEKAVTEVAAIDSGSVAPSTFTLSSGGCTPTGHPVDDESKKALESICDQFGVAVLVGGQAVFKGSTRELGEQQFSLPVPKPDEKVGITFVTYAPSGLGDASQGLGVSMPMTWTFQQ